MVKKSRRRKKIIKIIGCSIVRHQNNDKMRNQSSLLCCYCFNVLLKFSSEIRTPESGSTDFIYRLLHPDSHQSTFINNKCRSLKDTLHLSHNKTGFFPGLCGKGCGKIQNVLLSSRWRSRNKPFIVHRDWLSTYFAEKITYRLCFKERFMKIRCESNKAHCQNKDFFLSRRKLKMLHFVALDQRALNGEIISAWRLWDEKYMARCDVNAVS